jgi:hypothetical protein
LVVWKGSKMLSTSDSFRPGPVSLIVSSTPTPARSQVANDQNLWGRPPVDIASHAIDQQVEDHLLELDAVTGHLGVAAGQSSRHRDSPSLDVVSDEARHARDELADIQEL